MRRRSFLQASGGALAFSGWPAVAAASAGPADAPRLLVVLLRGGMDSLTAVPPVGDPLLPQLRPSIDIRQPLALDGSFGLHPRLRALHGLWQQGQLAVVHGTSFNYTGRSHFEGQDVMQSGVMKPYASPTGWLGRALQAARLPGGVAVSIPMPLLLRGDPQATTEFPNWMDPARPDIARQLTPLWAGEALLADIGPALGGSGGIRGMAGAMAPVATMALRRPPAELARLAAERLQAPAGPRVALIDIPAGFDTHGVQGADTGVHADKLGDLDEIVASFRQAMGEAWRHALVVTVTEFGRTVAENGTNGTDHGWGSCCFLTGGLVTRSQVHADWRGLAKAQLFEGRDLPATIDAAAVYARVLERVLGLAPAAIQNGILAHRPHPALRDLLA